VSGLTFGNPADYVTLETPLGTSIKNCKAMSEPPNSHYPSDVDYYLFLGRNEFSSCTPMRDYISWNSTQQIGEK
jgi:hypothetical protein